MKKSTLIVLHLLVWVALSTIYFFYSETITAWLLPDFHEVEMWLKVVIYGLIFIFISVAISLKMTLRRRHN